MAFPQTALPIEVALKIGSTWTAVTGDVRAEQQIRISRGRADEGQQVDTTRCSFTLDNNSGKYSPRNPSGPYYGSIGRNTPCRVSVLTGTPYLDLTGQNADYAETVDNAAIDITGDLDVRVDATLVNWLTPLTAGQTVELIGKFGFTPQKAWFLGSRSGRLFFEWSPDGTNSTGVLSTVPPVVPGSGRLAVRATLDVNNGAGGSTVRFYTAETLDSPWTQLGDPIVTAGTTSIFNSTAPLRIGKATGFAFNEPFGRVHSAEVRNGLWGTVVAQPYFSQQSVGATSFVDSPGRTWTVNGGASITNRQVRFVGEVSSWSPRWETRFDAVTQVEASGILRRLTQGASPVRSTMYREFTNPSRTGIVGYWPMEDDAGATSFASALDGKPAMPIPSSGGISPAAYSDWASSAPVATYTFGTTRATVPAYSATNWIFTRFFAAVPEGGVSGTDRLFSFTTTSAVARTWAVFINTTGNLELRAYDPDGTQLLASGFATTAINGKNVQIGVELTQNGANIDATMIVFYVDESTLTTAVSGGAIATLNSATVGAAREVRFGLSGLLNGTAIGHLAVANGNATFAGTLGAMVGWRGETTDARFARLCREEIIGASIVSASEETMGTQGRSTLVDLLRETETADEGILCEGRRYLGFRLRNHGSLYNQKPALTLDYTGASGLVTPLEPTDDDQAVRNDITVARTDGSSACVTLDTGTLSTQAPPSGVGRYADSVTLNLADDDQPLQHAGWQLHLGTWDETRYPVVHLVLSKVPSLLEAAAGVDVGDRIQITNPPAWLPPDTIDLMVQGYTETLDQYTWNLDFNCTPAGPWDVAWAGDVSTATAAREFQWVDTDGTQLAEDLTSTETDVDVLTTSGPVWTPNVRDTPFDWRVAGEVMTVAAPQSLLNNTNAFFDTDVSGWTGDSASLAWSTAYVHPHPRARGSMRITPVGGVGFVGALAGMTAAGTITPGATYTMSFWAFSVNGWSDIRPSVSWYLADGTFVSTSTGTQVAIGASVWTYFEETFTAPATASRAQGRVRYNSTPTASDVMYVWAARLTRTRSSWLYDTFSRTSSNSWGTSDSGLAWSSVGGGVATDYTLSGSYASHVLSTLNDTRRTGIAAVHSDFDTYCDMTTSAAATGDSLYGAVTARMLDANNMYMARAEFTTGNAILLTVRKMVAGVQTQLGSTFTLPFAHVAGTFVRFRFQGSGTALRARAWQVGNPEPGIWHIDTTDGAITAANQIGTRSVRITGNTNAASVEVRYDNYEVVNPQTYTVTRSANRVVKTQTAGAAVALADPAYVAL